MRIDSIASKPDRAGRYRICFEDGSFLRLYRQTVEDYGLYTGLDLTPEQMEQLRTDAGGMSAKMRAVRIVAASGVSKDDLRQRLIRKGEDPAQADEAVNWMEDLKLLDDRQTAQQLVNRCAARGYGLAKAKQVLYEKRIPRRYWQEVLEDYPDQEEHILAFLRSKLEPGADERQRKRVMDALLRRGHSYSEIRSAMRQLEFDEFPEDEYG